MRSSALLSILSANVFYMSSILCLITVRIINKQGGDREEWHLIWISKDNQDFYKSKKNLRILKNGTHESLCKGPGPLGLLREVAGEAGRVCSWSKDSWAIALFALLFTRAVSPLERLIDLPKDPIQVTSWLLANVLGKQSFRESAEESIPASVPRGLMTALSQLMKG